MREIQYNWKYSKAFQPVFDFKGRYIALTGGRACVDGETKIATPSGEIKIKDFKVSPEHLAKLVNMVEKGTVSSKQARQLFEKMVETDEDPNKIADKMNMTQICDENIILGFVTEVLDANPQSIEDFKAGKDRALGFLIGMVMKKSQGKANPALTSKIVSQELNKR